MKKGEIVLYCWEMTCVQTERLKYTEVKQKQQTKRTDF